MAKDSLTITDNRTGKTYELPIIAGTYPRYGSAITAIDLRQIKIDDEDFGLLAYDPGFVNTASTKSAITFIDGEKGILRYRGIPIEELADHATYLEVAYLLMFDKLPNDRELTTWDNAISECYLVHEYVKKFMEGFWHDAHGMGMFVGAVGGLSTFYPEAKRVMNRDERLRQATKILAMMPTIAAFTHRHSQGLPYVYPDRNLPFVANFLNMMFRMTNVGHDYHQNPEIVRALEVLFILHADHEQNCSTTTMRTVGSAHADPYVSLAAAAAALHGQLHGGANQEALAMLAEIGDVKNIPAYIERVKKGELRLMGFGHRVYKNYDPRAKIIKKMTDVVLKETKKADRLLDVAMELEQIALKDEYFVKRRLYPNIDFYSGIIYQAIGIPTDMFPVLFAIGRTSGWLAHWLEMLDDDSVRIARPRQIYTGADLRAFVPMRERK